MKNLAFLIASTMALVPNVSFAACEWPIDTARKAEECVQHKFEHEAHALFNLADQASHLGNTFDDCRHSRGRDIFEDEIRTFVRDLQEPGDVYCVPHRRNDNAWWCTDEKEWHIGCSNGFSTRIIGVSLSKDPIQIITLFPTLHRAH